MKIERLFTMPGVFYSWLYCLIGAQVQQLNTFLSELCKLKPNVNVKVTSAV